MNQEAAADGAGAGDTAKDDAEEWGYERIDRPTPNGGTYMIAYFFDAERQLTRKEVAVFVRIIEFDADGNQICRHWATTGRQETE